MNRNLRSRSIFIGLITLASLVFMFGPWNKDKDYKRTASDFFSPKRWMTNMGENIRLGLDLKGGTHLVLQVQADKALESITTGNRDKAESELKKANLAVTAVKVPATGQVVIETADASKQGEIREKVENIMAPYTDDWTVSTTSSPATMTFNLKTSSADRIRKEATEQTRNIVEQRINAFGVAEPTVQLRGREEDHQILVQMPGVDNPERVKELIKGEARLEIRAVENPQGFPSKEMAVATLAGATDKDVLVEKEPRKGTNEIVEKWYVVQKTPVITGSDLRTAAASQGQQGIGYAVSFQLKPEGATKFEQYTSTNIGNYLAVVLTNEIKSVAVIQGAISDNGQISGNFSLEQANDLALTLRSGALPATISYLEERTVGPSLGADSIRQGVIASIVGLGLVVLFMLFYYKLSGVNAVIALVLNLIILLAGLAMFQATLTLPGIAGVILLIGMAVDSNVLIFERIREEMRAGKIIQSAVDTGFNKALVTIIDTHVTTIVSSVFLFVFGTGPIRGFAVTLVIGLMANLFTAVFVSRTMFIWALNRGGRRQETISI